MTEEEQLTRYYLAQAGSGFGDFYSGPIYQRGYGIGSFLGGLFRTILPILKRGTAVVGREVLNSGANFLKDVGNNVNPREAFNSRTREALSNLSNRVMTGGGGYKVSKRPRKRQLSKTSQRGTIKRRKVVKKKKTNKTPRRNKKKKLKDIFNK